MALQWIVYGLAIYGFVCLWMHVLQRTAWWYKSRKNELQIVILLQNSEAYVEWFYRSIEAMSRSTGRPIAVTFVDCGSHDHTLRILRMLTKEDHQVQIIDETQFSRQLPDLQAVQNERLILVDLRH